MKKPILLLASLLIFALLHGAPSDAGPRKEVRFLTVGNSFAEDATRLLPEFVKAGGKQLIILRANIGGCSLEKHATILANALAKPDDPAGRGYKGKPHPRTGEKRDYSLPEALAAEAWDFVSIQQVSDMSYKPDSFEPHATQLIAAIKRFAPTAEILIHQTWAWREDCPKLADEGINTQKMYEGLRAAYQRLAEQHQLRFMPVGDAFQIARAHPRWTFSGKEPSFDYANPTAGTLPKETGSLNIGWRWSKATTKQPAKLSLDFKHANTDGQYLAAAVFYEMLYNDSVLEVGYVPEKMTPEDARLLRTFAHEAVLRAKRNTTRRPRRSRKTTRWLSRIPVAA